MPREGTTKAPAPLAPSKEMVDLAKRPPDYHLGLALWKLRHHYPDFAVIATAQDVAEMQAALDYNHQTMKLVVTPRRNGKGEDSLVIRLEDAKTGDMIIPQESTEAGLDRAQHMKQVRRARDEAPQLVNRLLAEMQSGTWSNQSCQDVCNALMLLSGEMRG